MEWLGENLWAIWLALAGILLIGELFTLDLILGMLGVGALGAAISSAAGAPWQLDVAIGAVVALALLGAVRPSLIRRLNRTPELLVGHQRIIGQRAVTVVPLRPEVLVPLKIDGEMWSARPLEGGRAIEAGEVVVVASIEGATAYVVPIDDLSTDPVQMTKEND